MKVVHLAAAAVLVGLSPAAAVAAQVPSAPAPAAAAADSPVDPDAVQALQKMGAYLTGLQTFELTAHTSLDLVTNDGQKLTFEGVARYKARKPDALSVQVTSDLRDRTYIYDGKQFTVFAPQLGYYATVSAPPTIKQTLEALHEKFGITLPLEDLFRWSAADTEHAKDLISAIDVGEATLDGVATRQYAFREGNIDWQVWIAAGDQPLPLKLMIVDRTDPAYPAYVARLTWTVNPALSPEDFAFHPPKDAKSIKIGMAEK